MYSAPQGFRDFGAGAARAEAAAESLRPVIVSRRAAISPISFALAGELLDAFYEFFAIENSFFDE